MGTGDENRQRRNLDHAQWRVGYFRSILDRHLAIPAQERREDWAEKEELHRGRLQAAVDELERLEKGPQEG
jgi:hypothetical protein